jgi:uncharacterized protein YbjT (DUF2867 family)
MTMTEQCILVVGATGRQGGSVALHLLRDAAFKVRVLTRRPQSEAAQALAAAGAELVAGNLEDGASLRQALAGCQGVFGVTNFFEHLDPGRETAQGVALLNAAAELGVAHVVMSTLPPARTLSGGALEVSHFDAKAAIEAHARKLCLGATFVHVNYYFENFLGWPPQRQADGTFVIALPLGDAPLAGVAIADIGGVVAGVFRERDSFRDQVVDVVGEQASVHDYARTLSQASGRSVVYRPMSAQSFAALGFPGASAVANMFDFLARHPRALHAAIEECRRLYPGLTSFRDWAEAHGKVLADLMPTR